MGLQTLHSEVTTYKLYINISTTKKTLTASEQNRTELNRLHKKSKAKPQHIIKKRKVIRSFSLPQTR
jgi:hypothetical protein